MPGKRFLRQVVIADFVQRDIGNLDFSLRGYVDHHSFLFGRQSIAIHVFRFLIREPQ